MIAVQEFAGVQAPIPAAGWVAHGYERVGRVFAEHLARGEEHGASFAVYHRGALVVDLWGGHADVERGVPWERDTRIVLFSVTKGLTAMAMHLLADRGKLDWDAPVAAYWPRFGRRGKSDITVRMLLNHRAGLPYVSTGLSIQDCVNPRERAKVTRALERQRPAWTPGTSQGYHAVTYGLYVGELFERIAGESVGAFLRRELLQPLGSDVWIGAPESLDSKVARLYPTPKRERLRKMLASALIDRESAEARITRDVVRRGSIARRAFANPSPGPDGVAAYNDEPVRRASLAWASATGSALGIARAYLPFAEGGTVAGHTYVRPETLAHLAARQTWSERDAVLQKPLGWSCGFLKEERHIFSPNPESFGHSGIGGALGWCDPVERLTIGYALNRMDWRVRSPRVKKLCRAVYESDAILGNQRTTNDP